MTMNDQRMDIEWSIYNLSTELERLHALAEKLGRADQEMLKKCAKQLRLLVNRLA